MTREGQRAGEAFRVAVLSLSVLFVVGAGCSSGDGSVAEQPAEGTAPTRPPTTVPGGEEGTGEATASPGVKGTPPPLNPTERRIVETLGVLGVEAERAELPGSGGASMWAPGPESEPLHVVAYPSTADSGDYQVVDEREVDGIVVETVEFRSGTAQRRFECEGFTYGVGGQQPADFEDMHAFVEAFVEAVACEDGG